MRCFLVTSLETTYTLVFTIIENIFMWDFLEKYSLGPTFTDQERKKAKQHEDNSTWTPSHVRNSFHNINENCTFSLYAKQIDMQGLGEKSLADSVALLEGVGRDC